MGKSYLLITPSLTYLFIFIFSLHFLHSNYFHFSYVYLILSNIIQVIKYNLCPWAKTALPYLRVTVLHSEPNNEYEIDEEFYKEFIKLAQQLVERQEVQIPSKENKQVRTLLIALPEPRFKDFLTFYDTVQNVEEILNQTGYDDLIQVASFHPDYKFASTIEDEDEDEDEKYYSEVVVEDKESTIAAFTNRSPYPMIHYLLVDDVKNAIDEYSIGGIDIDDISKYNSNDNHHHRDRDTSDIWKNNIKKMEKIATQVGGEEGMQKIIEDFKKH